MDQQGIQKFTAGCYYMMKSNRSKPCKMCSRTIPGDCFFFLKIEGGKEAYYCPHCGPFLIGMHGGSIDVEPIELDRNNVKIIDDLPENVKKVFRYTMKADLGYLKELLAEHPHLANARDYKIRTPLHRLYMWPVQTAKVLIENGGILDLTDMDGATALFRAVAKNELNLAELLIKHGAGVNMQNRVGKTALHVAAGSSNIRLEVVRLLLNSGGDPEIEDANGRTPARHAYEARNWEKMHLLK